MRKKTVSVITLQSVRNYGSVLQAYATQVLLEEQGFDVTILNYVKPGSADSELVDTWANSSGKNKILTRFVMTPTIKKWHKVFDGFMNSYLNLSSEIFRTNEDFKKMSTTYDAYCVGSDQVWNSTWNKGILEPFFLTYAPSSAYKFSFSSSFGKEKLDDYEIQPTTKMLLDFKHLSVREEQAVKILKGLGIESTQHIDPTLAMEPRFWRTLSDRQQPRHRPYLLVYQLNKSSDFDRYAERLAKELNLELVRICTRYDQVVKSGKPELIPSVDRFVSLFENASFVLTDSFHGTGFCINLNKPFLSIYPESFSSRISSILKMTGLQNRRLRSFSDFSQANKNIDFTFANSVLTNARIDVKNYLKTILEEL